MAADSVPVTLALGGGGARGFAHVGVLEILERHDIEVDQVYGVSAGALAGAAWCMGMSAENLRAKVLAFSNGPLANDARLRTLVTSAEAEAGKSLADRVGRIFVQGRLVKSFLLGSSVMGDDFFRQIVDFIIPEGVHFEDLKTPFACVTTDVQSGEAVVFDSGPLAPALLASCSVPGVAPAVKIDSRWLFDGGVVCLVPTNVARDRGAKRLVAVNVDRNIVTEMVPDQALEFYLRAGEIQAHHLARRLLWQADIVLTPDVGGVHWADFPRAAYIMDQGAVAAEDAIDRLLALSRPSRSIWRKMLSTLAGKKD